MMFLHKQHPWLAFKEFWQSRPLVENLRKPLLTTVYTNACVYIYNITLYEACIFS